MEKTIECIKALFRGSWEGEIGEERARKVEKLILDRLDEYSKVLGLEKEDILRAWERKRTYSATNFYQEANFPKLDKVKVFNNFEEFKEKYPSKKYKCPSCSGISTNPYECSCEGCDWKSYGSLKTMGKGLRFIIRDMFLENPVIDEIFMPIEEGEDNEK